MKPPHGTKTYHEDRSPEAYGGWREIPESLSHLPMIIMDVDGTLRGDVGPMTRLARPLVPRFLHKVMFREPWRLGSFVAFVWNLLRLWVVRTVNRDERRRYKHLFSELHHLAAAMMRFTDADSLRQIYRKHIATCENLWYPAAIELLRRVTPHAVVVLVTGSEQLQTEECVRLLADHGIDTSHIFVRGSLYDYNAATRRFTGRVRHLNVTYDGKRENVACFAHPRFRVAAAFGNSRPDRALFELVDKSGASVLVCTASVVKKRTRNFVLRKLDRSGFSICWTPEEVASHQLQPNTPTDPAGKVGKVLITDREFHVLLASDWLETVIYDLTPETTEPSEPGSTPSPQRIPPAPMPDHAETAVGSLRFRTNENN